MGLANGIGADEIGADTGGGAVTWTVDATSGIAVPSSAAEWSAFIAAKGLSVGAPDALWLLQEASGNPADSIGGFTLTPAGSPGYQQAESGWSRKAIRLHDGASERLSTTDAGLPDIASASMTTLVFANLISVAATRVFIDHGTTTKNRAEQNTTPRLVAMSGSNTATGLNDPTGAVKPFVLRTNRTAGSATLFSDTEKVAPTWSSSVTGKSSVLGSSGLSGTVSFLYACQWHASNAEMTDANLKALLQAMGFVIAWS